MDGSRWQMKASISMIIAVCAMLAPSSAAGLGPAPLRPAPYVPGKVLVGFRQGVSTSRRAAIEHGLRDARAFRITALGRWGRATAASSRIGPAYVLHVPGGAVMATVQRLRAERRYVAYAEPDYVMQESAVPNDPFFNLQWGSLNTGQSVDGIAGTPGADDGAYSAWNVTTGSRSVVIGEPDSGVDYTHPDLAANIWSNPGGIGGCPAGTHGYNVLASSCDPMDDETVYGGHGTHVAGIMGAVGNNGIGVAGMNWRTAILPVKWLNSSGWGDTSSLISALDWLVQAEQAGANIRVVNDSATFWGDAYSQALSDEIDVLGSNNILFVTAAGNTGDDNDNLSVRRYPCGYDRPTEICVTASDQNDQLPSWANYGPNTVDLAAPGNDIYSTLRNDTYGYISGGSMASAQVSGAAALILSVDNVSATALKADILNNVDVLPSLSGLVRTGGRLDVCKAMPGCGSQPPTLPFDVTAPSISGSTVSGETLTANPGTWTNSPTAYGYSWKRCNTSGSTCTAISNANSATYTLSGADVGSTLRVQVSATNAAGTSAPATSAQSAVVTASTATFGKTTIAKSSDEFAANRKRVNRYALSVAGSVSKLTIYLAPTSVKGKQSIDGVLYADSSGGPGTLLGTTTPITFASTEAAGWYDMTFPTPISLAAGNYWIGVITGSSSDVAAYRYDSVSGSRDYNTNTYSSGPSNPFGAVTTDSEQMSLYGTYTARTGAHSSGFRAATR